MGTQMHFMLQHKVPVIIPSMILMWMAFLSLMDNRESTSGRTQQEGLRLTTLDFSAPVPLWMQLNLKHLWDNTITVLKELRTLPPVHATIWILPSGLARTVYEPATAALQVACRGSAAPYHSQPLTTSKRVGALTRRSAMRLSPQNCWRSSSSNLPSCRHC